MPRYDYLCPAGHQRESVESRETDSIECDCGLAGRRVVLSAPLVGGFAIPPMRERKVPLSRFVDAQGEMVRQAERTGVPAPDVLGIARREAAAISKAAPELVTGT